MFKLALRKPSTVSRIRFHLLTVELFDLAAKLRNYLHRHCDAIYCSDYEYIYDLALRMEASATVLRMTTDQQVEHLREVVKSARLVIAHPPT